MPLSITDINNRIARLKEAKLLEVDESFVMRNGEETYYLERITSFREETPVTMWRFSTSIGNERYLVSQEQYDLLEALVGPVLRKS
jgi:hypothetical protein